MSTDETCDVLPLGYLDGTLTAPQTRALALSGAIPAAYVREAARDTLGTAVLAGGAGSAVAVLLWHAGVLGTWALTLPNWLLTLAG